MAENPVIRRFGQASGGGQPPNDLSANDLNSMFNQPSYAGPRAGKRYMTLDDVVQRTGAMLAVLLATGAVTWITVPTDNIVPLLIVTLMGSLAVGLYMAFTGKANAALCIIYSVLEGALLGAISKVFERAYEGIVVQALTGTVMVAGGMLFIYKIGAIRVTPRFTRIVVGATIGVFGLMLVNLVAYLFVDGGLGLRDGGPLAIVFSLVCIVIASMNLVMDFDMIERGIRNGADQKFAWYASFGLMVTLVWLYIEILRLLSFMRD